MTAENTNYENELLLRLSPKAGKITAEEHKADGAVAYKEISPIDLYYLLIRGYSSNKVVQTGFLPEHCFFVSVGRGEKTFFLWYPELYADMSYNGKEYVHFPIPRLVFGIRVLDTGKVAGCSLGVAADEQPSPGTPMYHYPFSNVHKDDRVCIGNNVLPKYKKQTALINFPRYLLGIPDNDDMFSTEKNKPGMGHWELMEHLQDKDPAYYYSDILIPNGKTLNDFIGDNKEEEDDEENT